MLSRKRRRNISVIYFHRAPKFHRIEERFLTTFSYRQIPDWPAARPLPAPQLVARALSSESIDGGRRRTSMFHQGTLHGVCV